MRRRKFIALTGTATTTALLAGCTDDDDEDPDENGEDPGADENGEDDNGEDDDDENGETYTLTVTVEDEAGEPLEGATVSVEDSEGLLEGVFDEEDEGETDADGMVEADVEDGEYTVVAEHDNEDDDAEADVEIDGADEEVTVAFGMDDEDE